MHDFCVVSLSDLMTELDLIIARVEYACRGDFVLVLYNPRGTKRTEPLLRAWKVISRYRRPDTPVGIVREATRQAESVEIVTVGTLLEHEQQIDMKTTIIVGNSDTRRHGPFLITPRGYELRKQRHG